MRTFAPSLLSLVLVLAACSKNADSSEPSAPPATTPAPVAPAAAAPQQPAAPTAEPSAPKTDTASPTAGGLTWDAPKPLVARTPKSSMRVAEYGLEDDPTAELAVFFFGSDQGGSIEANMTRWVGQFTQADGSETKAKRSERTVKNIDVSLVEARGTFSGGMGMPGAPPASSVPDAMLLAAIAKGPGGAVFFKLTGPHAAVEGARAGFDGLIESLRPAP